jgi:pectate lyase
MRLTIAIIATLAIWFPLGAFIGSRYTLAPRPPGAFSLVGVEAPKENGGFLFVTRFSPYPELADTAEQPTRSPLQLFENDRPLGPAHSATSDIRDRGNGRFWHSKEALYFSTSDNTDPRSNGRQYSWTIGPARPDQPPPD